MGASDVIIAVLAITLLLVVAHLWVQHRKDSMERIYFLGMAEGISAMGGTAADARRLAMANRN
jgi:hypothetical protein